jgi:hypothetical protein
MTKNNVRLPCPCKICCGVSRDYRTVRVHLAKEASERALFPEDAFEDPPRHDRMIEDSDMPDRGQDVPAAGIEDMVADEGFEGFEGFEEANVSHAESLPNCHEEVYKTVNSALYVK